MTENNVAAQAGDEPMGVCCYGGPPKPKSACASCAAWQVSPRATADVERDAARYRWLRERPYSDWKRIAFNTMDDHPFAIRCRDEEIDAAIATTKPGA